MKHPTVYYDQDGNNKKFSPAIHTGGYGDNHTEDEFFWAATELYFTTSETSYLEQAKQFVPDEFSIPSWGNVAGLGIFQWVNQEPGLVAGGANKGQEDAEFVPAYASNIPDESYQDNVGSYASNEIAINWNAYLVSLLGWIN